MIQPDRLLRVAVVGTSCCGKTTFARRLSQLTGAQHIELDALYWGLAWTPRSADEFQSALHQAIAEPRWICDGNYSQVRDLVWSRATAVVWLDLSLPVLLSRALRRTLWRCIDGAPVCGGNRESFLHALLSRESIPLWVLRTYGRRRREYPALLAEPRYGHLQIIRFRTARQAAQFLQQITPGGLAGCPM